MLINLQPDQQLLVSSLALKVSNIGAFMISSASTIYNISPESYSAVTNRSKGKRCHLYLPSGV